MEECKEWDIEVILAGKKWNREDSLTVRFSMVNNWRYNKGRDDGRAVCRTVDVRYVIILLPGDDSYCN